MRMPCILQRVGGSTWETLENVILSVKSLVMYYCNFSCLFLLSFKQFHLYATHIWTPDHHLEIFFCTLKCPQRRTVHTVVEWYCICTHNVLILQAAGQSEPPPPHTHTQASLRMQHYAEDHVVNSPRCRIDGCLRRTAWMTHITEGGMKMGSIPRKHFMASYQTKSEPE